MNDAIKNKRMLPSIRTRLAMVVLACVVPAIAGFVLLIGHFYEREREQINYNTLLTARAMVLAVDRDLNSGKIAALALATSPLLATDNLQAFHDQAQSLLRNDFPGFTFVLSDKNGQQVVNALIPFGQPLPQHGNPAQVAQVFKTGKPVVSDLFTGGVINHPVVAIDVPVWRDGKVVYSLAVGFLPERIGKILTEQRLAPDRLVGILDSKGIVVARSPYAANVVGKRGAPELIARLHEANEGKVEVTSLEGIPVYANFSRSPVSGWTVVIAVPKSAVLFELLESVSWISLLVIALLIAGFLLAWYLGGVISASIKSLASPVTASTATTVSAPHPMSFSEAEEVAAELASKRQDLERLLTERTVERDLLDQRVNERTSELQGSISALTLSEARLRSLTEGLPQMVWTTTPDARLDFVSHHWQDYSGIPSEQFLESGNWYEIVAQEDRDIIDAEWKRAFAVGIQFRCDCRLRRRDGIWRVFDHHALPQKNADGEIICWVGSSTDITEGRKTHDALLAAKDLATKANRAKSEFVANMSHEIRSPMNAVLGMLQLLRQTNLDERQLDYASKAEAAGKMLLGILNDILDFSKIEAGKLELDLHPFSLDKLLRDMSVILASTVGKKNIELLFRVDPALPDRIIGDSLRLQQVLLNLAGNAIKFTERGEVELSVRLLEETSSALLIAFAIRDTGIGISAEQLQHIFEGFSQAEASTARRYGGTGLGLAISQRLARLMGGILRVNSTPGVGSTFHFVIPCQREDEQPQPDTANRLPLHNLRCLVIDDNANARLIMKEMIISLGWQVDVMESGLEAIMAITESGAQQPYDVIFVDWRMPTLDGWETSRQIRQLSLPPGKSPLIIMVTAYDRELLSQKHVRLALVVDAVMTKPTTASMLFDAVADANLRQQRSTPIIVDEGINEKRLKNMRILVVEDNPTNQQVAYELLSSEGAQIEVADCGKAAIDIVLRPEPRFDLILMDIQMPDMDGYAVTRTILAKLPDAPPIIAMTANAMAADREAALSSGMVDHVGKPFDLSQLISIILKHTSRNRMSSSSHGTAPVAKERIEATTPPPPAPPSPIMELNSAAALARFGGNKSVYQLALNGFITEVSNLTKHLQNAQKEQQAEIAARLLHTLKGLAGTVGADQLATLALQTEQALKNHAEVKTSWDGIDQVLMTCPLAVAAVERFLQLDSTNVATSSIMTAKTTAPMSESDRKNVCSGLTELSNLLAANSMKAFLSYEALRQRYGKSMPNDFLKIQPLLEKMDFSEAARLCAIVLDAAQNNRL